MRGGKSPVTTHDGPQVRGHEFGIGRLAEIEPDRSVRLLPAVAVVEMEARRQLEPARRLQRVLFDHDHPGSESGAPDVGVEEARVAGRHSVRFQHERRQQNDEMARRYDEVVHHAQW